MNNNQIYAAITGIDERYLSASEDAEAVAASIRTAKRKRNTAVLSLCACLLLAAVAVGPVRLWLQGAAPSVDPTVSVPTVTNTEEVSKKPNDNDPVSYSTLAVDGHEFKVFRGAGMLDIAAFSEDFLQHAELIIEGTVTDTHTKQYYFVCEAEGKFEYAGQKMTITYKPETIVTTVRIEKIWKGDGSFAVGDTVTFEDEIVGFDGIFGYHTGITYLLHLDQTDEENLLVMTGQTSDEPLIEGDNHREFRYRNGYPFQPAIEKTAAGDYIVPGTWKTVTQPGDANVVLNKENCPDWDPENSAWYLLGGLKLVPSDQFEARMHELFERMGTEYMDAEE